jgi:23S rRNA (adenine2503-C2)-methyltransferase
MNNPASQVNIFNLKKNDLSVLLNQIRLPKFRLQQIYRWLYTKGIFSFDAMSNIAKAEIAQLKTVFKIDLPLILSDISSIDKTRKWLLAFEDGSEVEMVFIPEDNRGTLCISSQVGCTLSCKFCYTGTQLFVRNLQFGEIVAQLLLAKHLLQDFDVSKKIITNIVFMGMGEPFFNYDNVSEAVKIMNDSEGLNYSLGKITVSTAGLVPEIIRSSTEIKTNLAVSLHSAFDNIRSDIMAINKKYNIDTLMKACREYNKILPQRKIMFEYSLLENVNDSEKDALELVRIINKYNIHCKVNIIPFNSWCGVRFNPAPVAKIIEFQKILKKNNIMATIRKTRGDDNLAACGQLKSSSIRQPLSQNLGNN